MANGSNGTLTPAISQPASSGAAYIQLYIQTEYGTGIALAVLSPITVVANALLLTAISIDPLRCFRTPVTYFIAALAVVDCLTGAVVEPFLASYYFARYNLQTLQPLAPYPTLLQVGGVVSTVAVSSSFLIVLALSVSQILAVTLPHKYRRLVSTRNVILCVAVSLVYFIIFASLQFAGVQMDIYYRADLYLHPTLISILLIVAQIVLYKVYRNYLLHNPATHAGLDKTRAVKAREGGGRQKQRISQRQMTVITLMLASMLLLCSMPHTVILYIFLHKKLSFVQNVYLNMALKISDVVMFLKVIIDPFIYAWRLPKYRRALAVIFRCNRFNQVGAENESHTAESSKVP